MFIVIVCIESQPSLMVLSVEQRLILTNDCYKRIFLACVTAINVSVTVIQVSDGTFALYFNLTAYYQFTVTYSQINFITINGL